MTDELKAHGLQFDNSFADQLEGFYVPWKAEKVDHPTLLHWNDTVAQELGWEGDLQPAVLASVFSGNQSIEGMKPIAQAYAGHQFGGFSPQLGDGRALLLGEVVNSNRERHDLALKGSGPTPFSRGGDGRAAVGPVLREYLIGEFMHAVRIPTTRALAAVSTGESVYRNGPLPGAVLTRVASSHLRVGTFEFFAARRQSDLLKKLTEYTIQRHCPNLEQSNHPELDLLEHVSRQQARLIAKWMSVGFIHGVMNTDNMTISGETIDYGPCAFMENYRPNTVFSSIDTQGRYAYDQQPSIGLWNLSRFAECLIPLVNQSDQAAAISAATEVLEPFMDHYKDAWIREFGRKLGLSNAAVADQAMIQDWLHLLQTDQVDYTLAWRGLVDEWKSPSDALASLFSNHDKLTSWLQQWKTRLSQESVDPQTITDTLESANPVFIPRNHHVEHALESATNDNNLEPFENLLRVISAPFQDHEGMAELATPADAEFTACYKTFCGT